jgi:group I intron endonuclease
MIGIYKITNPKGKIYIGQSIQIEKRWERYKYNNSNKQTKLYNSFKKYGYENHTFEVLEKCNLEQLNEKETYWKQFYLNILNNVWDKVLFHELYDLGGGPKSKKTIIKMKYYQSNRTIKHNKKISEARKKPILQYDLEGNFIKEWDSTKQYADINNLKNGSAITACLKKRSVSAYGSLWAYKLKNNIPLHIVPVNYNYITKSILQYDLKGNFIKEWDSIDKASNFLNIKKQGICNVLKNRAKSSGNYIWKYK